MSDGDAQTCARIKLDGHLGASVQLVPNVLTGNARVEVYNMRGQLLAHQTVPVDTDRDQASAIGFALFNGFIFGYRSCEQRVRQNVETLLDGPDNPLS